MAPGDKAQGKTDAGEEPASSSTDGTHRLEELVRELGRQLCLAAPRSRGEWGRLSEEEQLAWQRLARSALGAIRSAGYSITALDDPADGMGLRALRSQSEDNRRQHVARAERFLRAGEPLLAYNTVSLALRLWPEDLRLRQLMGIALARSGAVRRAYKWLKALRDGGAHDGETLGPLARTQKDLAGLADSPAARNRYLAAAFEIYEAAYREAVTQSSTEDAYYTGINAAAMALLRNDQRTARAIAVEVRRLCDAALQHAQEGAGEYWIRATLAEADLILGNIDLARTEYAEALAAAGRRFGDVSSTRRQARRLLGHLGEPADWLDEALAIPPVLVFTGHMLDRPEREAPRFAPAMLDEVAARIRREVERIGPVAAYGSAACGADILSLEAVHAAGGEIHIVLPFPPEEFRRVSVDFLPDGDWGQRFDRLIEAADEIHTVSEHFATGSESTFEYTNLVLTGLGILRADRLGTSVAGLAVWDGARGDGPGGTGSVIDLWRRHDFDVVRIDPSRPEAPSALSPAATPAAGATRIRPSAYGPLSHEIKSMLFADAVGYSGLTEDQIPVFIEEFLGTIARLNRDTDHHPIHMEVAGDGLYMVFDEPGDAGHYGLALAERIDLRDWKAAGLPATMGIRVALHSGPVFCGPNPITGQPMYTGPHTSRTARIEPITPPGQVYASAAFAAVAAASGVRDLHFSYIGRTQLAKKHGSLALYYVRRP